MFGEGFWIHLGFEESLTGIEAGTIGAGGGDRPIGVEGEGIGFLFEGIEGIFGFGGEGFFFEDGIGLQFGLEEML